MAARERPMDCIRDEEKETKDVIVQCGVALADGSLAFFGELTVLPELFLQISQLSSATRDAPEVRE
jgi:hypothetical protein